MVFLGNSYTIQNSLEEVVAAVFAAAGQDIEAERLANPGWRYVDHVDAIETDGTSHAAVFAAPHDWMVLQEQSQIPGFPDGQADFEASRTAAVTLDGYVAATGAQTLFLMTWGRRDGDSANPDMYPDYGTMQGLLAAGYTQYVVDASADGTPAFVAPAGLAWARVYEDVVAEGQDPLEAGGAFYELYVSDGSHPSLRGTWLTACVIYASITGESPVGLEAPFDIPDADYLASVAAAVVLEGEGITYPWSDTTPDDTGADDTGPGDTGDTDADDTGPGDTADSAEDILAEDPGGAGCGCDSGGGAGLGWIAGALLVFSSRRTRSAGRRHR